MNVRDCTVAPMQQEGEEITSWFKANYLSISRHVSGLLSSELFTWTDSSTSKSLARRNLSKKPREKLPGPDSCSARSRRLCTKGPSCSEESESSESSGPSMVLPAPATGSEETRDGRGVRDWRWGRERKFLTHSKSLEKVLHLHRLRRGLPLPVIDGTAHCKK